jgi:transposase InsO family protein
MIKSLLLFFRKSFETNLQLKLEVIFLTKQIEILQRTTPKIKTKITDRIFFIVMMDLFSNWKERIFIVKPDTLIRWHRKGFRIFWKRKTKNNKGGRPKINKEVIELIKQMAIENPLWGVPRVHGELLKLGYDISQSTVQRYFPKRGGRTIGQRWKTFLRNHSKEIISVDFLTVPTINFKMIYILIVIDHYRRRLIHFNITQYPNPSWTLQQIRNMLFENKAPKYLIRYRDSKYGGYFSAGLKQFGINQILTSYRSPWQNGYVERVIGSIKRECLDHVIVLNENHLRTIMTDYVSYYNKYRTHLGLNKDSPEGRPVQKEGQIEKILIVNGLHHYYYRKAA